MLFPFFIPERFEIEAGYFGLMLEERFIPGFLTAKKFSVALVLFFAKLVDDLRGSIFWPEVWSSPNSIMLINIACLLIASDMKDMHEPWMFPGDRRKFPDAVELPFERP